MLVTGPVNVPPEVQPPLRVSSDGRRNNSFATIGAALEAAPVGGVVVVGAGIYKENLVLDRAVHLKAEAAVCRLQCECDVPAVVCAAGVRASISGFLIEQQRARGGSGGAPLVAPRAVHVSEGAELRLHRCEISSTQGIGVAVERMGSVSLFGSLVHKCFADGILAADEGSRVSSKDSSISKNRGSGAVCSMMAAERTKFVSNQEAGVSVSGRHSKAVLSECVLKSNKTAGAVCKSGAELELLSCKLETNGTAGCRYTEGGFGAVTQCVLQGNKFGVEITTEGDPKVTQNVFEANAKQDVWCHHGGWGEIEHTGCTQVDSLGIDRVLSLEQSVEEQVVESVQTPRPIQEVTQEAVASSQVCAIL